MTSRLIRGTALLAALFTLACGGDDPAGPVPGPLRVVLTTPNADDGAVMFQLTGVVDSVVAPAGVTLYQAVTGSNVLRAIAIGNLPTGSNLMTIYVADVAKTSSYSVQLLQVAAAGTYAQRPIGAYGLTVQK
ncbi:MAG TPA: hypothetical protein VFV65_07635 [Gemmatimonadales bacterium]|nr:hypothetical protein [Gemmatimonadales bacterium]